MDDPRLGRPDPDASLDRRRLVLPRTQGHPAGERDPLPRRLPERGGNIFRLIDKPRDLDLLWKSPRVVPHLAAIHADFDDHWAGGWDDAFPGGRSSRNRYGDLLPYMGEVWTAAGQLLDRPAGPGRGATPAPRSARRSPRPRSPARSRCAQASRASPSATNSATSGYLPFDYNWGIHPCLAVQPTWRFDIPATRGLVDEAGGGLLGQPGDEYAWPVLGGVDLRQAMGPGSRRVRAALPDRPDRGLDRGHRHRRPPRVRPVLRPRAVPGGLVLPGVRRLARLLPGAGRAVDRLPEPARRSGAGGPGAAP